MLKPLTFHFLRDKFDLMPTESLNTLLDEINRLNALIYEHQNDIRLAVEKIRNLASQPGEPTAIRPTTHRVKSLRTWSAWLYTNGPATRQQCIDGTGVALTVHADPHVLKWRGHMEMWDDTTLPGNTVMVIPGLSGGKGRPPSIYFLWSQRYSVLPKFSVGPVGNTPAPMLGVIQPAPVYDDGMVDTIVPDRCLDLDEWELMHRDTVENFTSNGIKPTGEERQHIKDTCPDGYPLNEAIAHLFSGTLWKLDDGA